MTDTLTRRQTFKLLAGAAALAVLPTLPTGSTIAVADPIGALLPMDGSYVSINEFPELAAKLLEDESLRLKWLKDETRRKYYDRTFGSGYFTEAELERRINRAQTRLAAYMPITNGAAVRIPIPSGMPNGQSSPQWHPHGNGDGVWFRYDYYIQARPDETGTAVGAEIAVRNLCEAPVL